MNANESVMACTVVSPTPRNKYWLKFQSKALTSSVAKIDKFVVLNGLSEDDHSWEDGGYTALNRSKINMGHGWGLKIIIDAFKKNTDYSRLLILDSDAWPIDESWFHVCERLMHIKEKNGLAVVRCENFDTFPHPCVFMANRKLVNKGLEFKLRSQVNLLGELITDLSLGYKDFDDDVVSLTRSNKVNYHPLFGGIYSNIFYHHGAGSRFPGKTRLASSQMCDHYIKPESHVEIESKMFDKLVRNYDEYIGTLKNGLTL